MTEGDIVVEKPADVLIFDEADLAYEEDIIRNPYSLRCWLRYADHKRNAPIQQLNMVFERAVRELPGSYKLWYNYLKIRRKQCQGRCVTDPLFEATNNCFERSLVFMHKMPRIWMDYCEFLVNQQLIIKTRKVFDRALRALPITQHLRIWPLYLKFIKMHHIPETALRVYRRYLKICPENKEDFVDYLLSVDRLDEAAVRLAECLNDEKFVSKQGKTNHQMWSELCEIISTNPHKVKSLKVEPIIRQGLRRYTDQTGKLWCSLADYYIRAGHFVKARDIYEEAIQTVTTVRDFTQVFDAYAQFEEQVTGAVMEKCGEKSGGPTEDDNLEIEMRLARFENLMDRRPLLLNSVLLRQNPHNVHEWLKRVKLFEGQPQKVIDTFTEAVQTVDVKQQTGKLCNLWVAFAKFYENNNQLPDARDIFKRALKVNFPKVDDLAFIWCEYAEMELRHDNFKEALELMRMATAAPRHKAAYHDESEASQVRVHKSLKVWSMYADLEESFGTFDSCKAVYDRILDLKIATPQVVVNYGVFLEEHNHFEEAFKAYEKAVSLFKWPNVVDIWSTYLTKFIKRYGGKKLERTRDLFEQCLDGCPQNLSKSFYLLYAKLEEDYGLARHAMAIYERAAMNVAPDEQYEMFNIYIKKAADMYGITHTRPIYEKAIETLPEERSREMCIRFAELERKLGEVDRARAIYAHCSQLCDPRIHANFWNTWKEFEIKHGNEDTVREMLRIKRSVQATFNTQVNFMSAQMLAAATGVAKPSAELTAGDSMALLEAQAQQLAEGSKKDAKAGGISFVRGDSVEQTKQFLKTANPDEINLDEDDEPMEAESHGGNPEIEVISQSVPTEVYGNLADEVDVE